MKSTATTQSVGPSTSAHVKPITEAWRSVPPLATASYADRTVYVGEDVFEGEIGFSTKLSKDQWPEEKQARPAVSTQLFATHDRTQ